ncbi:hypothetical protein PVAND_012225 [Polypedilum vanderplanki]|uniref:Uncharacterized protein n=1 Tax=Polypedilum vanderplanki TaxID=319348 RepID=A0A9J6CMQ6_POLVA|nr:hypothetical protein PVAND_012225 [Polypedilum vanderplanki]
MVAKFIALIILIILKQCNCENKNLPCEFVFEKKFGYTCKVTKEFDSTNKFINITGIIGDHCAIDKTFNFSNKDVIRVMFFDRQILYIPANINQQFPSLKTLQIKKCGLLELTRENNFHSLRRMYLGFNKIKNIPKMYFWHFCRLEILSLSVNQISNIPQMAFRDLINLKRLSLNGNRLMTIDPLLFVRCTKLQYVDFDNNQLQSIDGDWFAKQSKLYKVSLSNNGIQYIDTQFFSSWQSMNVPQTKINRYVIFKNNSCIDFSFNNESNFEQLLQIISDNCSIPLPTTPAITTTSKANSRTKKPKYKPKQVLWFDFCEWNIQKEFQYLYKSY